MTDAALRELSDAECDEIIGRVTGMPGKGWPSYDHRLVRAGYRAGAARVGIAREPTPKMIEAAMQAIYGDIDVTPEIIAVWHAMYDASL